MSVGPHNPATPGAPTVVRSLIVPALLALATGVTPNGLVTTQRAEHPQNLPPVEIDALGNERWSVSNVVAAPGQTLIVTDRGVEQHTFTVDDWGIAIPLPNLPPVEITIPANASPGTDATVSASPADHVIVETADDFSFTRTTSEASPGGLIEVRNNGVIEHNFVVDA